MDTQLLVGAIVGLWAVLTTLVAAAFKHLIKDNERLRQKVEKSSTLIENQAEAQAKMIESQQGMIVLLQEQKGASTSDTTRPTGRPQ